MYKFIRVAFLSCALSACLVSASADAKTLRVGTEPTFAPFEFIAPDNTIIGYNIDIIKAVASAGGYDVEMVSMPFDGFIPALTAQSIDVVAGMTITQERAKKVDFTAPYYDSALSAVVLKINEGKYQKLDDLKNVRPCSQIGDTGVDLAKSLSNNVGAFNTHAEAFMELKSKGCEAVITDRPVNEYFIASQKHHDFVELNDYAEASQFGSAVKKGNTELLNALDAGLKKIRENGIFNEIHQKWFGTPE